jgi:2-isopropylmalate synthase
MSSNPSSKYRPFPPIDLPDRQWPSQTLTRAPLWCSVDLRDGNQALPEPMGHERKLRMWKKLVEMGFPHIEIGFPSASQTEFDFARFLVENREIPDGVVPQVLTQARESLIRKTFEAVRGMKQVIVHVYNSTSTLQRKVVFNTDRKGIIDIATSGIALVRKLAAEYPDTEVILEYSPESFTGTELDFARDICEAVMDTWQPTPQKKLIFNLPGTVEMATPNVYADQIEWFARNTKNRDCYWLSLHPHNDRGTSVAACELALMAGADRVEGTLFGNGERTGNLDVVTVALNLMTQGVDPNLNIGNIRELREVYEYCNRLPVHPRHPYAGELVFTAFSGSHQDAIKKGLAARKANQEPTWEVPYLPIDPGDIGRDYEPVIRINSQSGKGGVAYVMEQDFGFALPRALQVEFSKVIQEITDDSGEELSPAAILKAFEREYLEASQEVALHNSRIEVNSGTGENREVVAELRIGGKTQTLRGEGNGPIDAFVTALRAGLGIELQVLDYSEHSVGKGAKAQAVAYVQAQLGEDISYGVGRHESILTASVLAVLSAANRLRSRAEKRQSLRPPSTKHAAAQ